LYYLSEPQKVEIPGDLFNNFVYFLIAICWGFINILNQLFSEFSRHID